MAWEELLSILAEAQQEVEMYASMPPQACPNDGYPLQAGPHGELHCPFDGWTWQS